MKKTFLLKTMLLLCALMVGGSAWATDLTTADFILPTPQFSENFNSLSATSGTGNSSSATTLTSQTSFGIFDKIYCGKAANTWAIESNNSFGSNVLSLSAVSGSPIIASITGKSFGTKGAFSIKMLKTDKSMVGFYAANDGNAYAKANASVYIQNTAGVLSIGSGTAWVSIGTYTSEIIELLVIYNNTESNETYGDDIALASKTAHVYVNGTCVMDGANPKAFTIPGTSLTAFRVLPQTADGNHATIDDVKIYNSLPTYSAFTITSAVNDANMGSAAVNGTTITATPNAGYRVISGTGGYTVTSGTATVTNNGDNTFSVSPTSNCTVQINFEAIPTHKATFYVNGAKLSEADVLEGAAITFPANPASIGGKNFMGWIKSQITGTTDTAPTEYYTSGTMSTANVNYYAVFASSSEATAWSKLAASEVSSEGTYALLTTDGHAFNGTINSSGHGTVTTDAFSFTNNIATSAPSGTCEITLQAVTGGYKMYNADNGYLYASAASSGKLAWHNSESSYWSYATSNWKYNSNGAYLRSYNNGSLRTYGSNTGDVLVFAKKITITTYSAYCTTLPTTTTPAVTEFGWATYIAACDMEFAEGDAFIVTAANLTDGLTLEAATAVPQGTPLLLKGQGAKTAIVWATAPAALENNLLTVSNGTFETGQYPYVLAKDGTTACFKQWTGAESALDGRVVLILNQAVSTRSIYSLDEDMTGVQSVVREAINDNQYYNLSGQRVDNPTKGLYIVNGKKVVIK